jgi:hypothetical protein
MNWLMPPVYLSAATAPGPPTLSSSVAHPFVLQGVMFRREVSHKQGQDSTTMRKQSSKRFKRKRDDSAGKRPRKNNESKAVLRNSGEKKHPSNPTSPSKKAMSSGKHERKSVVRRRAPFCHRKRKRTEKPTLWTDEDRRLVQASYLISCPRWHE